MKYTIQGATVGAEGKLGAALFFLCSILHIWGRYYSVHQYLSNGTPGLWTIVVGGGNAPRAAFVHTTDAITAFAQGPRILNFCIDVGGCGVLGLVVAWLILNRASWPSLPHPFGMLPLRTTSTR